MENKVIYVPVSTAIDYPPVGQEVIWTHHNGEVFKGKLPKWDDDHAWVDCTHGMYSVFDFSEWLDPIELPNKEEQVVSSLNHSGSFGEQLSFQRRNNLKYPNHSKIMTSFRVWWINSVIIYRVR